MTDPSIEREYTELELRRYTGDDGGPMYIAFQGIVYDVSACPNWRSGIHRGMHFPGQDLSIEISEAPHNAEVFQHPQIKRVGRLAK